ncbi:glycerophosphodiester phosphodiesterase family protein [Brevundimonas sp. VNH65]|uniref:glycerophosphodiester phosphodiesterase family protein n=1 Tax=Brevundimonas sp. VNH65 TaxID=3400917 RepID=UPI003BFCF823
MFRALFAATLLLLFVEPALAQTSPLIIAHRGASGERPEHTRAAYELAVAQGADVIEPDLVMSKDGHLVVRHENEIGETTNVADRPEFADRRTTRAIDGRPVTGWFTEDFTLQELRTLHARERLPALRPANTAFADQRILTFADVVDIAREQSIRTGRTLWVAPELKHPSHFAALGLDMEAAFLAALHREGLTGADAPVLVQCFEVGPLERLSARVDTPLLQLMSSAGGPVDRPDLTYAAMATPPGLAAISRYAQWIGVETGLVLPRDADGRTTAPTALIADAHAAGLKVSIWTLRAENLFLPAELRSTDDPAAHGDMTAYARAFADLGADALFSDFPGLLKGAAPD